MRFGRWLTQISINSLNDSVQRGKQSYVQIGIIDTGVISEIIKVIIKSHYIISYPV